MQAQRCARWPPARCAAPPKRCCAAPLPLPALTTRGDAGEVAYGPRFARQAAFTSSPPALPTPTQAPQSALDPHHGPQDHRIGALRRAVEVGASMGRLDSARG